MIMLRGEARRSDRASSENEKPSQDYVEVLSVIN